MNAQFEIEKRKLAHKISMRENGLFNGLGSWLVGSLAGKNDVSLVEKSMELIEQMPSQEKIETLVKASSFFTSKKRSSLGLVVFGSIVGGMLAAKVYMEKSESGLEGAIEKSSLED